MSFAVPGLKAREVVANRIGLIDADCVAYWAAAGCDDMALKAVTNKVVDRMDGIMDQIQTSQIRCFLTGPNNFRDLVATYQQYKGNRYNKDGKRIKPQPAWLQEARDYIQDNYNTTLCNGYEADDGLAMAQIKCNASSGWHSIISSIDKDLRIIPGLHHNMNSGYIDEVTELGDLYIDDKKKVRGSGLKFFYAQLLMGDSADWIPGLPKVTPYMKETYGGIKRLGGCGPMAAYHVVVGAEDEYTMYQRVMDCYASYWDGSHFYRNWRTEQEIYPEPETMLLEQARLLWMQREPRQLWTPPKGFHERWITNYGK